MIAGAVIMAFPSDTKEVRESSVKVAATPVPSIDTQVLFKQVYMNSCSGGTVSEAKCDCMYDYVVNKVGFKEMTKMAGSQDDKTLAVYYEAAFTCEGK